MRPSRNAGAPDASNASGGLFTQAHGNGSASGSAPNGARPVMDGGPVIRYRVLVHCTSAEDEPVATLMRCATRAGADTDCVPLLNGATPRKPERPCDVVVLHCKASASQVMRSVTRHLHAYRNLPLVVLADDATPAQVESMMAEGVAGVIPARYNEEAMAGALLLVLAGEVFCPYHAAAAPTPAVAGSVGIRDFGLTKVESEVLALAAQGLTNLEISLRRGGVEGTVKVHMNHIFNKLNVRSRCEAIAVYLQSHNVDPEELRRAQSGDMDMKWLLATMTHEHHLKGTTLFRRGQQGDKIYYLQNGTVRLQEIEVDMKPRDLFGEIGVFAPEHKRTCTAVCSTDVDLFTLSIEEVRRCYFLNPQFAFYVMYLITQRLMADRERFNDSIR